MKLEALALAISSYAMSSVVAVGNLAFVALAGAPEQQIMLDHPIVPEHIFWPSLGGAAVAALMTIQPAFKSGSDVNPAEVAFQAFVTITGGFLVGFYLTQFAAPIVHDKIPWGATLHSVAIGTALIFGILGEKFLQIVFRTDLEKWKGMLPFKGGK